MNLDWLLKVPGFRSGQIIPMIAAALGYFAIILYMTLGKAGFVYGSTLLLFVLFNGNVGGLKGRLPLFGHQSPWVRRTASFVLFLLLWYVATQVSMGWDPEFLPQS